MWMNSSTPRCRRQRDAHLRRGFVLILVLFAITMASMLMLTLVVSTGQFVRTTRSEHVSILLRQLTDSGWAWMQSHHDGSVQYPVTLDAEQILPIDVCGEVRITVDSAMPESVVIEARIKTLDRSFFRAATFPSTAIASSLADPGRDGGHNAGANSD